MEDKPVELIARHRQSLLLSFPYHRDAANNYSFNPFFRVFKMLILLAPLLKALVLATETQYDATADPEAGKLYANPVSFISSLSFPSSASCDSTEKR